MKILFFAFLFATILASAILIVPHQRVSAQQGGATLVIRKVVEGLPPNSDWEFDMDLNVAPYSTIITIDKAGGGTTIVFAVTQVQVSIVERTKSNYVVYLSDSGSTTRTHAVFIGTGRLINQADTVIVEFINQNTLPAPSVQPVGGVVTPIDKLEVAIVYITLFAMISASIGACIIKKSRNA